LILAGQGATVHILDLEPPKTVPQELSSRIEYHQCDITSWASLRDIFQRLARLDFLFANAGVSETVNSFEDTFDEAGLLQEPSYGVLGVNLKAVLNVVKLGWSHMRKNELAGSIVLTISATAYAPEQSLPVYSAAKLAVCTVYKYILLLLQQKTRYPPPLPFKNKLESV
jgi:NAD(P)-dependent dehydrogenase (short-subunit alcohol dehydrogenase family)